MYILEFYNWDFMDNHYIESKEPITKIEFEEKLLKVFEDMIEDDSDEICKSLPSYYSLPEKCNKFKKALKKQGLYLAEYTKESVYEYTTLSEYREKLKNDIILEKITNELSKYGYDSSYGYNSSSGTNYEKPHLYISASIIIDKNHYNEIKEKTTNIVYKFCQKENIPDFFDTLQIDIMID